MANDSHDFRIDDKGCLWVHNFCLKESMNKDVEGQIVGCSSNPMDIQALACEVDRSLVGLWKMISAVVTEPGFSVEGGHFTSPEKMMSISTFVQAINLGIVPPGTTAEASVELVAYFDFSAFEEGEREKMSGKVDELAAELGPEVGGVEAGDCCRISNYETELGKKMWLSVCVESPDHAREMMIVIADRIRGAKLHQYWMKDGARR